MTPKQSHNIIILEKINIMPKQHKETRKDRLQNASTPYQRQELGAKHDAGTQQEKSAPTPHVGSVSNDILALILQPSAAAPQSNPIHPSLPLRPAFDAPLETPRSSRRKKKTGGISHAAPLHQDDLEENEVPVKHAKYWNKCVPIKRRLFASLIVDIENINDKHDAAGQSSATTTSNPIRYRTLCFLTKKPIPIRTDTDTLPVFNPPLPYVLAPRYSFKCQPGPPVDLTGFENFTKVRQYTNNLMKIMAKETTFELPKSDMPYLILPILHNNAKTTADHAAEDSIDWEEVNAFAAAEGRPLERQELTDEIRLKALVDDGLFGYHLTDSSTRFQVVGVRSDLCPGSRLEGIDGCRGSVVPIMSVQPRKWRDELESRMEDVWEDQPIFEVETAYDLSQGIRPVSSLRSHCRYKACSTPYSRITAIPTFQS
ncbi:hypothetical protein QFC22_003946 [Naganishia vaughanmartiniae]|uniref:Uncharacterized protein n=1 Tax=Naganishia vaughanmartiniae TaxID=1424756 RepID=A0ACC2X5R2_9TREE|nr:hypothetical protein QFC22_003946 [Naganishia vaughanmartiniae]